jgi:ABC-type branched-subunit amino acid transport system substrate-binding protein
MNLLAKGAVALLAALGCVTSVNAEIGVSASTITIGQSAPLSGINQARGTEFRRGALGWFEHVNQAGGIYGRKIELQTLDDAYDPVRAEANTKTLLGTSFVLFGYVGAAPSLAGAKLFMPAGVPLIAPYSGEPSLHDNKWVWNLQGTYADESRTAIKNIKTLQLRTIGVLYQDDQLGKASLEGIRAAAANEQMTVVTAIPVKRDGSDVEQASAKLLAVPGIEAYFLATAYSNASHFIVMKRDRYIAGPVYAQSAVGSDALMNSLGHKGGGVMVTQVVPNPTQATNRLVLDFQRDTKPPYTYAGLQGYFSARVLADALKEAGSTPTHAGLMAALRSAKGFNSGPGLYVDAQGYRHVDISILTDSGHVLN